MQSFESVRAISKQNNTSSPLDRTLGIRTNDRASRRSTETNVRIAIRRKVDAPFSTVGSISSAIKQSNSEHKEMPALSKALPSARDKDRTKSKRLERCFWL